MGRRPAFDRQDVLAKATQVFLTSGYQGTTIKDITNATGLQPGSIYSAFVNKEGLYAEVIEYYTGLQLGIFEKCCEKNTTHLGAIKDFFYLVAGNIEKQVPDAHCLLVQGAFEIPESEKQLRYYAQLKIQEIESRLYVELVRAQEDNEIVCEEDPIELVRFLMTLLFGHSVLARLQPSAATVINTIDRVFKYLQPTPNLATK